MSKSDDNDNDGWSFITVNHAGIGNREAAVAREHFGDNSYRSKIIDTGNGVALMRTKGGMVQVTPLPKQSISPFDPESPFNEVSRTYFEESRMFSSDGLFSFRITPIATVDFQDVTGKTFTARFKSGLGAYYFPDENKLDETLEEYVINGLENKHYLTSGYGYVHLSEIGIPIAVYEDKRVVKLTMTYNGSEVVLDLSSHSEIASETHGKLIGTHDLYSEYRCLGGTEGPIYHLRFNKVQPAVGNTKTVFNTAYKNNLIGTVHNDDLTELGPFIGWITRPSKWAMPFKGYCDTSGFYTDETKSTSLINLDPSILATQTPYSGYMERIPRYFKFGTSNDETVTEDGQSQKFLNSAIFQGGKPWPGAPDMLHPFEHLYKDSNGVVWVIRFTFYLLATPHPENYYHPEDYATEHIRVSIVRRFDTIFEEYATFETIILDEKIKSVLGTPSIDYLPVSHRSIIHVVRSLPNGKEAIVLNYAYLNITNVTVYEPGSFVKFVFSGTASDALGNGITVAHQVLTIEQQWADVIKSQTVNNYNMVVDNSSYGDMLDAEGLTLVTVKTHTLGEPMEENSTHYTKKILDYIPNPDLTWSEIYYQRTHHINATAIDGWQGVVSRHITSFMYGPTQYEYSGSITKIVESHSTSYIKHELVTPSGSIVVVGNGQSDFSSVMTESSEQNYTGNHPAAVMGANIVTQSDPAIGTVSMPSSPGGASNSAPMTTFLINQLSSFATNYRGWESDKRIVNYFVVENSIVDSKLSYNPRAYPSTLFISSEINAGRFY